MSEQLSELYPVALEMGIPAETFWNLSVNEIFDTLANIRKRLLREEKQRIMDNFIQAQAIAVDISALFAKDGKIAHPWDYYPELFEKEQKAYEEAEEARQWEGYLAEDDQMNGKPVPGMYAEDVAKYYPVGAYNNEEGLVENWNERMIIPAMLKLLQNLYKRIS